jgi:hypothetical protein
MRGNSGSSIHELMTRLGASLAIQLDSHSKPMVCTVAVGHPSVAARIVREAVVDMSPVNHRQ